MTQYRAVGIWLAVCCLLVFAMVVLGGVTRLTQSGLSMVEWSPIIGAIPPVGLDQWQQTFDLYKQFPEYQKLNQGMTLPEFKQIFWFEYGHRVLGRIIGLAFIVPLLIFIYLKKIPPRWSGRLLALFILGGLQGLLGWYMVKSGLVDNPHVSQYRLTAHLCLAVFLYAIMFWYALDLLRHYSQPAQAQSLTAFGYWVVGLIAVMIVSGGFVAGTRAGFVFNTFPTMHGQWLPSGLWAMQPQWRNLFENVATVQFIHRCLALCIVFVVSLFWYRGKKNRLDTTSSRALNLLMLMMMFQVGLGITTLLTVVEVPVAALHQAGALVLLTFALYSLHCLKKTQSPISSVVDGD